MKIRNGFVSNSSSCSFTCDVCGETESGFDVSLEDCDMKECVNGHTFCESHMTKKMKKPSIEQMKAFLSKKIWTWGPDKGKPEYDLKDMSNEDVEDAYNDEIADNGVDPSCCPVCQFKAIPDNELVSFFLKNQKRKDVVAEIKAKFDGDYSKFLDYIKEVKSK